MASAPTIAVFGAEGPLGSIVAERLARIFEVKVILSKKVTTLKQNPSISCCYVRPESLSELCDSLQGVDGAFVTTNTDFNAEDGYNEEVRWGEQIAESCLSAKVKHVVLHTAPSATQLWSLTSRHLDAKCAIGKIMKRRGVPLTCFTTAFFYEQLLEPPLKPRKQGNQTFAFGG